MVTRFAPLPLLLALLPLACSEAGPPRAQGSSIYRTKAASADDQTPGATCLAGIAAVAPENGAPELPPASGPPTNPGEPVYDDIDGYEVKCTMESSGNSVILDITMSAPVNYESVAFPGKTTMTLRGTVNKEAGAGVGTVTFFTPEVGAVSVKSGSQCSFTTSGGGLELDDEEGSLWLTFACPTVTESKGGAASLCQSLGSVVLEKCDLK